MLSFGELKCLYLDEADIFTEPNEKVAIHSYVYDFTTLAMKRAFNRYVDGNNRMNMMDGK